MTMYSTGSTAENIFINKFNSPNLFRLLYPIDQVQLSTKSGIARQINNDCGNVAQNESTKVQLYLQK